MKMREQMARAVFAISAKKLASKKIWEDCTPAYRDLVLGEVDAALDALMANPGEAVLDEGFGALNGYSDRAAAGAAFQGMIAAIKEGK